VVLLLIFDFLIKNNHNLFQNIDKIFNERYLVFPTKETKPDLTCGGFIENDSIFIDINEIKIKKDTKILINSQSKNYNKLLSLSIFKEAIESLNPYNFYSGFQKITNSFFKVVA